MISEAVHAHLGGGPSGVTPVTPCNPTRLAETHFGFDEHSSQDNIAPLLGKGKAPIRAGEMDDDFDIPLSPSPPQVSNSAWSTALLEIDNVLATSVDDSRLLRFKLEEHDRLMITLSAKKSALVSLRSCNSSIPTPLFQELRDLTARLVKLHKSIFAHGSTEVSSSLALPLNTSGQSLYLPSTSSATIPLPEAAATRSPQSQSQAPPSPPPPVSPAVDIPAMNYSPAVVAATPSSSPVRQLSLRPSNSSLPARNTDSSHSHLEDHVLSSPPMSSHHPRRLGPQISKSSSLMEKARNVLQKDFRLQSFRSHQEVVIRRLLDNGLSAVAIIPTGGGKSLCCQIPALCLNGLTLVVSPHLSLIKDQVDGLQRQGIKACCLDSFQSTEDYQTTMDSLRSGELKLLYVTPERLNTESVMQRIRGFKLSLLAVDESHCVAECGNDFRPEYLQIARFAVEYNAERVLCLTAAATDCVAEEICRAFGIDEKAGVFRVKTFRSNLKLMVQSLESDPHGSTRLEMAVQSCLKNPGPTIVYTSEKNTQMVATHLQARGINARPYYAAISLDVLEWFMETPDAVICGTIAFDMGPERSILPRNVIHFNVPKTLEGYSQEVGRAGRDGQPSNCTLFLCQGDRIQLENVVRGNTLSRKSVKAFIERISREVVAQEVGINGMLVANNTALQKSLDIRDVTLALLFSQLELRLGLLRASTPIYVTYYYKESEHPLLFTNISKDNSPASIALRQYAVNKKIWRRVDPDAISKAEKIERNILVNKLNEWSIKKWIDLKPSQKRNRYVLLKPFTTDPKELEEIGDKLFEQLEKRERLEVQRSEKVFRWAADYNCLARGLAEYFDDKESFPNPDSECGQCTVCTDGPVTIFQGRALPFNDYNFKQILASTSIRDDARFLARVALGITTPRITAERLHSHQVFGSMQNEKFEELLERFQVEVDVGQAEHPNGVGVPVVGRKRKTGIGRIRNAKRSRN